MFVISIPTKTFRSQNAIFHEFYARMHRLGVTASDFSARKMFSRKLSLFQIHFPEHFATNYSLLPAIARSAGFIFVLLICQLRSIPIVWTVHNVTPFERRNLVLCRLVMAVVIRLTKGYIFLSQSSMKEFDRRFSSTRPALRTLIPHPAYPISHDYRPSTGHALLGMIGEQKHYKEPLASLQLYRIAKQLTPCRLLVGGKVHDASNFRAALATFASHEIEWLDGRLDDAQLELAAKRCDFILLPYSMATNSGAALFALSCGRPIIATPLPLFLELREFFGSAWVRIVDGEEKMLSFWTPPTQSDYDILVQRLKTLSLEATAVRHKTFFKKLLARNSGIDP